MSSPIKRPPLFRALGKDDPPESITIEGREFSRIRIFKHDSWAATALYESGDVKYVCKFNRRQSIFGFPMGWLGRRLAYRESFFYRLLADLPCIPSGTRNVCANGKKLANAFAHPYIEGRPLHLSDSLPDEFFGELRQNLDQMHSRGVAYVDLNKRENIILGDDGHGYLVDFQISFYSRPSLLFSPLGWFWRFFQQGDLYHLEKHRSRCSQEKAVSTLDEIRPRCIRAYRKIGTALRTLRRRLLTLLKIRDASGMVYSEEFTEDGLRMTQ